MNVPEGHSGYLGLTLERPIGGQMSQLEIKTRRYSAVFFLYFFCLVSVGLTLGNPNVPQGHSQIKERTLGTNETTTTHFENPT